MCHVFSPTRDELQRWSQSFDQLMRSPRTYTLSTYFCFFAHLKPNYITLSMSSSLGGRRPVRDQIPLDSPACDQLASWFASCWQLFEDLRVHVVCVSQAKFYYAIQLASRSQTSSRPNSITLSSLRSARAGRELDSVMKFGRELVCDLLASKIP